MNDYQSVPFETPTQAVEAQPTKKSSMGFIVPVLFIILALIIGLLIGYGLGNNANVPSSDNDKVNPTNVVATTLTPVESDKITYTDPELGFSLSYDSSWDLEATDGTFINDGTGRTIILSKRGYDIDIQAQNKQTAGSCGGLVNEGDELIQMIVDGENIWRRNSAMSLDDEKPWIEILSPDGEDSYTCSLEFNNKIYSINYFVDTKTSDPNRNINEELLAEMDEILKSMKW